MPLIANPSHHSHALLSPLRHSSSLLLERLSLSADQHAQGAPALEDLLLKVTIVFPQTVPKTLPCNPCSLPSATTGAALAEGTLPTNQHIPQTVSPRFTNQTFVVLHCTLLEILSLILATTISNSLFPHI